MLTPALASTSETAKKSHDLAELREAARAFEAIFLRQILASARASTLSDHENPFAGPGLTQFTAMRDEHFAELTAKQGGLGLADQIEAQLSAMITQREA